MEDVKEQRPEIYHLRLDIYVSILVLMEDVKEPERYFFGDKVVELFQSLF